MKTSAFPIGVAVAVLVLGAGAAPDAIFVRPDVADVPVERVLANLTRQLEANPKDARLHARIARVHLMAYALQSDQVPAERTTGDPWFGYGPERPPILRPDTAQRTTRAADEAHLRDAIRHYRDALAIAPNDATARLGYAWALDQSGDAAAAIGEYRKVIELAWPKEREKKALMPAETSLAVEAGGHLEKLLDPVRDNAEIDGIRERRAHIDRLPRAITPIAVPLGDGVSVRGLVDPAARVAFDADGTALPRRWTWISRDAAWLVFDPRQTGRITSSLQLFGSVTFWLFWHNGYEALAALDDDGSGELRAGELAGLALWHDRDGNAVSNLGEVRPLAEYGIVALSCRPTFSRYDPDVAAFAADGVRYANGTTRPTYDVILRSAAVMTN